MTITQLRAFLVSLELGSFTAAAAELVTTQASVSELIARLERELQVRLFTRGGRRLVPTEAALALREHAQAAVSSIDHGVEAVRAVQSLETGTCTFGVLRNAAYYNLSDLVERFHHMHPGVRVRLVGLNSALVADSIARDEIEAGLVVLPIDEAGLTIEPLFRDEVLYASTTRDPDAGPATIEEVSAATLVLYDAYAGWSDPTRRQLLDRARLRGLSIEPAMEVEHVETALSIVASGAADTIVSRTIAESEAFPPGIRLVPFAEPLVDTIALVHRAGVALSPATQRFAALAKDTLLDAIAAHPGRVAASVVAAGRQ
jgi:DNA-binding transcriptional LysR family regulator